MDTRYPILSTNFAQNRSTRSCVKKKQVDIRDIPGATWRDVVAAVLEQCDEAVPLTYLYEQIEPHQRAKNHKWWKEKIRQTLQYHPEHFQHVDRGLWRLRKK